MVLQLISLQLDGFKQILVKTLEEFNSKQSMVVLASDIQIYISVQAM
jgi:hypothetical protein